MSRLIAVPLLFPVALAGCMNQLPRPQPPPRMDPSVSRPSQPPPANHGRVAFDVVQGNAIVEVVEGRTTQIGSANGASTVAVGMTTRRLCTTPCMADLPLGQHEVRLRIPDSYQLGVVPVDVKETPSALRVDLGWTRPPETVGSIGGYTLITTGVSAAITGLVLFGVAHQDDTAWGLTLGGSAAIGLGVYLSIDASGEIRPSSSQQWDLDSRDPARAGSTARRH